MFKGSMVALVTPMLDDGSVDDEALAALVELHVEAGTDAIVAVGTSGESATLTVPEHARVIGRVVKLARGRIPVIAGTGANATAEAIELTRHARTAGADACLLVTPYYNKPTQEGLYRHYAAIAAAVDVPQILYNVPGAHRPRHGAGDDGAALAAGEHRRHQGGVRRPARIASLVASCASGFMVVTGDDASAMESCLAGGHGDISVTATSCRARCTRCAPRRWPGSARGPRRSRRASATCTACCSRVEPDPGQVGTGRDGLIGPTLRLPLTPLAEEYREAVRAALRKAGALTEEVA